MSVPLAAGPRLRQIVNLWSLTDYPSASAPWPLERQLAAVQAAGFDGFSSHPTPDHARLAQKHGLVFVGFVSSGNPDDFHALLAANRDAGATHINVQLADHDTPTADALALALRLLADARPLGVLPAVEVHRDTCTETPEKTYALAEAYQQATGELLPLTWDHSHLAVVKHLAPPFSARLLVRPDLIQHARQFHFRPFNGHHCQVPVTDGRGNLTAELRDWLPFVEDTFRLWRAGNPETPEIFAVPEMGPVPGGYNLSTLPNSWEDAQVLRPLIAGAWERSARA